uniref:Mesothelin-like protein n=1 Tax=Callorhinchus milii TaxID=7868 RepID=A0A4W3JVW9_CALMI
MLHRYPQLIFFIIFNTVTAFCENVTSLEVNSFLKAVNVSQFCNFTVTDYACAETNLVANLSDDYVTDIFDCFTGKKALRSSDETALTVFIQKLDGISLNKALDMFNNKTLNSSTIPLITKTVFMKAFLEKVKTNENLDNATFLTKWFQERFGPFIAGIPSTFLDCLLIRNTTCGGYQAVVKGLSNGFREMPLTTRQSVLRIWILGYLNSTGAGCINNTNGSRDWLVKNWGTFYNLVQLKDLTQLNSNFSAFEVLDLLNPRHFSELTVNSVGLNNIVNINKILNELTKRSFSELDSYMVYFVNDAKNAGITDIPNTGVRDTMLSSVVQKLEPQFTTFKTTEYADWFQEKLQLLLPSVTSNELAAIPTNITCQSYRAVIKGLDNVSSKLSVPQIGHVYAFVSKYLSSQLNTSGSACVANTTDDRDWLLKNFATFQSLAKYSDFIHLKNNFTGVDVVDLLTLRQLADLTASNGTLKTPDDVRKVMSRVTPETITQFMDIFSFGAKQNNAFLAPNMKATLLTEVLDRSLPIISRSNDTELQNWFGIRLEMLISELNGSLTEQILANASCSRSLIIIQSLNAHFSEFNGNQQTELYNSIKDYLQKAPKTRCFDSTNQNLNSPTWFVNYLGKFMIHTSVDDLTSLVKETDLQKFTVDPANLNLVSSLALSKDIQEFYAIALFKNTNVNFTRIPDSMICFASGTPALESLNAQQTLEIINRTNQVCQASTTNVTASTEPTDEEMQLAISLVNKIDNFSSATLVNLGQSAVGLTTTQIESINKNDVLKSLDSLGKVSFWNTGQAKALISKLFGTNFQVNNAANILKMGSLVSGLSSKTVQSLDSSVIVSAVKSTIFVNNIKHASGSVQRSVVQKIFQSSSNSVAALQLVPASLADKIPLRLLTSKNIVLSQVNKKIWKPNQAAMFFPNFANDATINFDDVSGSVLQGFTCSGAKRLKRPRFKTFVKALRGKAQLDSDQLYCLSRRLGASTTTTNITDVPEDVLLFFDPPKTKCKDFYRAVGRAKINILKSKSRRRKNVFKNAKKCLNSPKTLSKENVEILNNFVCDYDGDLQNSDISILEPLKKCSEYTDKQKTAINFLLNSRGSTYGEPSKWTISTLEKLQSLVFSVNEETWRKVSTTVIFGGLGKYVKKGSKFKRKDQQDILVRVSRRSRFSRATGCTTDQITAAMTVDPLLPAKYSAEQLRHCLNNDVLKSNLQQLGTKAFSTEQLNVLKTKLNEIYPDGVPEEQIVLLGIIAVVYNSTDVSKWNITSDDTLSAVLPNIQNDEMSKAIISRYLEESGALNTSALNVIGANLCVLDENHIHTIVPKELGNADPIDVSSCSQSKKFIIYYKAFVGLQNQNIDSTTYYNQIKTYLGGIQFRNLKTLAINTTNLDPSVFLQLNPDAVQQLTASELKNLLGENLNIIKEEENSTLVMDWIRTHTQSEVRSLGLGLTGGIEDPSENGNFVIPTRPSSSSINQNCLLLTILPVFITLLFVKLQTESVI